MAQVVIGISCGMLVVFSIIRTANAEVYAFDKTLSIGSRGASVEDLQKFHATDTSIYPEGLITGNYGPLTAFGMQKFQCRHDIVCSGSVTATGYGRVGPITLAKLIEVGGLAGTGGSDAPTADVHAPIVSPETISTTTPQSVTIRWTSSEPARSKVYYSRVFPFVYGTAANSADTTFDTDASVSITGLMHNTLYYYARESVDSSGDVMWTSVKTFGTQ